MVKTLTQRGFKTEIRELGDVIVYYTDKEGLEHVHIQNNKSEVNLTADEGKILNIDFSTPQISVSMDADKDQNSEIFNPVGVPYSERVLSFAQAREIYHEVKKLLNVDEKIRDYRPRFSSPSELTLYNILGIEDASELGGLIGEDKE